MIASKGKTNNITVGTEYQLKRPSLVAKMKSVNQTAPAKPTINPARYNRFLTSKLTAAPNVSHVKSALAIRLSKQEFGVPIDIGATAN